MKRKSKIKPVYECRCNGRLQTKRFTRLSHTGFFCFCVGLNFFFDSKMRHRFFLLGIPGVVSALAMSGGTELRAFLLKHRTCRCRLAVIEIFGNSCQFSAWSERCELLVRSRHLHRHVLAWRPPRHWSKPGHQAGLAKKWRRTTWPGAYSDINHHIAKIFK